MSKTGELKVELDNLEALLLRSAGLGEGLDKHRKKGVEYRRQIGEKVALIGSLGEHAFGSETRAEFRREFSKLRSALALHQASWPIVAIDVANAQYQASVQTLRETSRSFISWVRSALAASD